MKGCVKNGNVKKCFLISGLLLVVLLSGCDKSAGGNVALQSQQNNSQAVVAVNGSQEASVKINESSENDGGTVVSVLVNTQQGDGKAVVKDLSKTVKKNVATAEVALGSGETSEKGGDSGAVNTSEAEDKGGKGLENNEGGNDVAAQGGTNKYVVLAKCLSKNGVSFYGAYWCPHCQKQKQAFGDEAMKFVNFIECDPSGENAKPELCEKAKVDGYPTWIFKDGSRLTGEQDLSVLAKKAGCSY